MTEMLSGVRDKRWREAVFSNRIVFQGMELFECAEKQTSKSKQVGSIGKSGKRVDRLKADI